jgi:signal transduction histidine kinase
MFRSTTFRRRIFWSLIPNFCALFGLLGVVDLYQQKRVAEEEISARAKSMAENLAHSSRLAVLTEDKWLLDATLQSVTGAADFAYVWIYGEKWKPLVHAPGRLTHIERLKPELDDNQKARISQKAGNVFNSVTAGNESYFEYIVPITSTQSTVPYELQIESRGENRLDVSQIRERTIGAVRLGLSMNRVDTQLTSFLKWRGWSLLVFLCLSALAIYVFSVTITRPINRLTEQAKRMSHGFLNEAIPVESRDEVGQLAMAFNDMGRALNDLYIGLERKVVERTKELTRVNQKLAEASEHKSRFLANVNHELRTPLSSIIGYARLLRRETEGHISSLQRENLEDLLRNAERLLALIDSLLDLAKIESGKMEVHPEPVQIDELVQSAVTTVEPMLNKEQIRLVCDVPIDIAPVYTDGEKLRQIVLNLLGNAAKFTDRGEIKISACQVNGDFKLAVADTGIGIDNADLARIFEEFDRGRLASEGQYHGTGLGLAIVKRLVDLLGGSVAVESEVGKGSIFTVTIPVDRLEGSSTESVLAGC